MQQDIHAKIYMVRKHSDTDLYLGSLSASHNAISGNVEFMIRLRAKNRYLNLAKLTEQLFFGAEDAASNPFQRVSLTAAEATEATDDPQNVLNGMVKELARNKPSAKVINNGDAFELQVYFGAFESPYQIFGARCFKRQRR